MMTPVTVVIVVPVVIVDPPVIVVPVIVVAPLVVVVPVIVVVPPVEVVPVFAEVIVVVPPGSGGSMEKGADVGSAAAEKVIIPVSRPSPSLKLLLLP